MPTAVQVAARLELIHNFNPSASDGRRALAVMDKTRTFQRGSFETMSFDPLWLTDKPEPEGCELTTVELDHYSFDLRFGAAAAR